MSWRFARQNLLARLRFVQNMHRDAGNMIAHCMAFGPPDRLRHWQDQQRECGRQIPLLMQALHEQAERTAVMQAILNKGTKA